MADTPISSDPTLTDAQLAGGDLVPVVDISEPAAADKNKNTTFTYIVAYSQSNLLHDSFSDYAAAEHIDWSVTGAEDVHVDRIAAGAVTQHEGSINHDALLNFDAAEHFTKASILLDDLGDVVETTITTGDLLRWNGSNWVNYADSNFAASSHSHTEADITLSATDRLVGRDTAGGGAAEELTVSGGLEFTGTGGIQRSALTGDVTASAGSNTTAIAADAVDLTEMAHGTQGDILYYGASGVPARLGAGTSGQVLTTNGAAANPSWQDSSGGGLTATYKTANYTAVAGDFVLINLGGTNRTITLPATIAAGDRIAVHVFNTSATAATCTIGRNSKTIRYRGDTNGYAGGTADDITMYDGETIELIASDTSNWEIV